MARYIDAEKLQEDFEKIADEPDYMHEGETWQTGIYLAGTITDKQPTADVVEVKHGRWEEVHIQHEGYAEVYYNHKECKISPNELYKSPFEHCPRCGAKMDGCKK